MSKAEEATDSIATGDGAGGTADAAEMLLNFVRQRDVPCPLCGYNLRDLTQPVCPECRQDLMLTVGMEKLRFGWLIIAVAPGIFSGIAAAFLLIPLMLEMIAGSQGIPWQPWALDLFGWASGITALLLARHRYAFVRQSAENQRLWALGIWGVHIAAFFTILLAALGL